LPGSPFFGFLAVFEDPIARGFVVGVRDDHSPVVVLGFLLIFAGCGDGRNFTIGLAAPYCIRPSLSRERAACALRAPATEAYSSYRFPCIAPYKKQHQVDPWLKQY
jgi:hypothetical protein